MNFKFNSNTDSFTSTNYLNILDDLLIMTKYYDNDFIEPIFTEYFSLENEDDRLKFINTRFSVENFSNLDVEDTDYLIDFLTNGKEKYEFLVNEQQDALTSLKVSFMIIKEVFIEEKKKLNVQEINSVKENILKTHIYYTYQLKEV